MQVTGHRSLFYQYRKYSKHFLKANLSLIRPKVSLVFGILSVLVKQWPVTCDLQKKPAANGTLSNALTFCNSHRAPGQYYGGRRFIFFLGLPIFFLFLLFLQPLPVSLFFYIGAFKKLPSTVASLPFFFTLVHSRNL